MIQAQDILHNDDFIVVVNKPVDLPVHKNEFMALDAPYVTKEVGILLECSLFPVHRLDAKTSGVLVLAKSREVASKLSKQFEQHKVVKTYAIVCKGQPGDGMFDTPVVIKKQKKRVPAKTEFQTIRTVSTQISYKDVKNTSISLVHATPATGKWHQLRQHFAMNRTDIIGDTQHGDWTLNRIVTALTGSHRLLLHAFRLELNHPQSGERIVFQAPLPECFEAVLKGVENKEAGVLPA